MITPRELTAAQLRELTFELQAERARLTRVLAAQHASEASGAAASIGSMEVDGPVATRVSTTDTDARMDAIEAALERMDAGTYGTCTACNLPIPFGRLIVMPEATHCVSCWPR